MTEMIERVARAIYAARLSGHWAENDPEFAWDAVMEKTREVHRGLASAAIEAMREPTERMLEAMGDAIPYDGSPGDDGLFMWQSGIDAALAP